MTRKALARRIAQVLFNEPATRRGAGAAPTRRAARILAGCFVARRSKTTAGILPPRAAHPAKIRSSAAIRASDLVHWYKFHSGINLATIGLLRWSIAIRQLSTGLVAMPT